jgi:hypothetical protein
MPTVSEVVLDRTAEYAHEAGQLAAEALRFGIDVSEEIDGLVECSATLATLSHATPDAALAQRLKRVSDAILTEVLLLRWRDVEGGVDE